ncbi:MAG: PDDEXK nuclease domain-containing protein [ANME-2 cluster archaeon]|jgi:hypothetical protein|nr:PDDEXK nuclease domain-containing protein [ANME-2 cluster archaeon]
MSEHDLKTAILTELELSLQEVSPDFMLIPRQKGFSIDSEHRVVDLVFYHRNMQCMIPVYLKFGELQNDDIEWMQVNLRTLLKYKMRQGDEKPIGFILCVQDNKEHVELVALEQSKGFISKNLIEFPLKQIFISKLHDAVLQARKPLVHGEVYGRT